MTSIMCPNVVLHMSSCTSNFYPYAVLHVSPRSHECVLINKCMCPQGTHMCPYVVGTSVLTLLCMCPQAMLNVSSSHCAYVLKIGELVSSRTLACVLMACRMCPQGKLLVSSRLNACVLTLTCLCPHVRMHLSSRQNACVLTHGRREDSSNDSVCPQAPFAYISSRSATFKASILTTLCACVLMLFCFYQRAKCVCPQAFLLLSART